MNYKIVSLYESNHHIFNTESYGYVDVRTLESGTIEEIEAAKISLESFTFSYYEKNIIRLITILESDNLSEVIIQAKILFEETVDLISRFPIAEVTILENAGYFVNMDTGLIKPFIKKEKSENQLGRMYHIRNGFYSRINAQQFIAAGRDDELVKAYFRSINWYNKSKNQNRLYLKFLYKWISLETISKINIEETIVPKLCLSIGFPLKNDIKLSSPNIINKLNNIENYKTWRKFVYKHLEECRNLRNNIVHSGFKETDFNRDDMIIKMYLVNTAFTHIIEYIEQLILTGITTLNDAWKNLHSQIEKREYLIKDVEGNIIFNLKNKKDLEQYFVF